MIAFGSSMTDPEAYRRYARPGIELAAEHDSEVYAFAAAGSICRSYNLLLDTAATRENLDALVIVGQEVEIADPDLCEKVRLALRDPDVGAVGCVGATAARTIAWWEGEVSAAPTVHHYHEHGEGELPAFSWTRPGRPPPAEVETLDGSLLALSPWAVRNVRFDEALALGHGYDLDYCLQLRTAGRRLVTADLRTIRHSRLELVKNADLWIEAHIKVAEKWNGRMPGVDVGEVQWKQRARRAEAEREVARTAAYSTASRFDARVVPLERALEEMTESFSWRITTPLRRVNGWRRAALRGRRS